SYRPVRKITRYCACLCLIVFFIDRSGNYRRLRSGGGLRRLLPTLAGCIINRATIGGLCGDQRIQAGFKLLYFLPLLDDDLLLFLELLLLLRKKGFILLEYFF